VSTPLVVNNKTFNYPSPGESPGWGEEATAWAEEVTSILGTVAGTGDIPTTTATLANDIGSAMPVSELTFNPSVVRGAKIQYSITRTATVSGSSVVKIEEGEMHVVYNGTSWELIRAFVGEADIEFTVTNTGQFQYTSSDISGGVGAVGYVGSMKFKATALTQ
jgi:hypothetical protein